MIALALSLVLATGTASLESLLAVLSTADQTAYEQFAQKNYSPAALAEYPAAGQADSLARIYADTGGFQVERIIDGGADSVQAEAVDRITKSRYCLTLSRKDGLISDFTARAVYPAGTELTTPEPQELVRTISHIADDYTSRHLFSGVILIAKGDKVIFERAYGNASLAWNAPMSLQTRLNVASIGKMMTGVAIAQLVETGKLSYDDTVGKLLPDYPEKAVRDRVTVRQLLAHTSGLGPKDYYQGPAWQTRSRLRSVADFLKVVEQTTSLEGEPGKYEYMNSGYIILGAIIERVTGGSFYDYVREHIFEPAGMTHSFYPEMDSEAPDVAVPLTNLFNNGEHYIYRLGHPRNAIYELAGRGGPHGGAYLTARDLFAFVKTLRSGTLVGPARYKEMTTPQSAAGAGGSGLTGSAREGLGIEVVTRNGHTFFGHTGGDLGVASLVYWYPDSGYTTIVLANRDPRAARVLANITRALITRRTIDGAVPPDQTCGCSTAAPR
jgi:CubicO group peptidase (beta-lactamase class C family)